MKKFLIVILSVFLIFTAATYFMIPSKIHIKQEMLIHANPRTAFRAIADENNWKNWMTDNPADPSAPTQNTSHSYNGMNYRINKKSFNAIEIIVSDKGSTVSSSLSVLPVSHDSAVVEWRTAIPSGYNPFQRIRNYRLAKKTSNSMKEILASMQPLLGENGKIYHLDIYYRLIKDTVMMATRETFEKYPSTRDIYKMIGKLKDYIRKHKGRETNFPMLNVNVDNDTSYEAMVAIPVDHSLPEKENFFLKRMLYKGNLLEAEVKGGPHTINQGFLNFNNYIMDYGRTSAAIPFEMLITDRFVEPDTSKWVTKLFYPVY